MYPMERKGSGDTCDATYLDMKSSCCGDNQYTACKEKPCLDYEGECSFKRTMVYLAYYIIGEKLLPDDDFSGYDEKGNASTRRGFLFSNDLGTRESFT